MITDKFSQVTTFILAKFGDIHILNQSKTWMSVNFNILNQSKTWMSVNFIVDVCKFYCKFYELKEIQERLLRLVFSLCYSSENITASTIAMLPSKL
ncbi:Uncharacterised protein [Candidatus Venteria ishoeyi]|uniref:Uncharacterized protein n=1 Tax=Candidatus Venteria ishoeyi TaxID=1899563 RepID=A0A1H6F6I8_9GAMM|nr:Uncharacterised protein [Candidatus Venteria ishoeyi]